MYLTRLIILRELHVSFLWSSYSLPVSYVSTVAPDSGRVELLHVSLYISFAYTEPTADDHTARAKVVLPCLLPAATPGHSTTRLVISVRFHAPRRLPRNKSKHIWQASFPPHLVTMLRTPETRLSDSSRSSRLVRVPETIIL